MSHLLNITIGKMENLTTMTTHVTVLTCIIGLEPGMTRYVLMSTSSFARPRKVSFRSVSKIVLFETNVNVLGEYDLYLTL